MDVVGDVRDLHVLRAAGVDTARAILLALNSESATLLASVVIRDLAAEVPIIARLNEAENVERVHQAGADYALSISQVSNRLLARRLLGREGVLLDARLEVLETVNEDWAGRRPDELDIRANPGCSLIAVGRGEEILVDMGQKLPLEAGDSLYFCGSSEALSRLRREFNLANAPVPLA